MYLYIIFWIISLYIILKTSFGSTLSPFWLLGFLPLVIMGVVFIGQTKIREQQKSYKAKLKYPKHVYCDESVIIELDIKSDNKPIENKKKEIDITELKLPSPLQEELFIQKKLFGMYFQNLLGSKRCL